MLAGVGLYGVLDYSVLQRRREVAIRMALGAQAGDVARRVTADVFSVVFVGGFAGLVLGLEKSSEKRDTSLSVQVSESGSGRGARFRGGPGSGIFR